MNFYLRQTTNKLFNSWRDMIKRCYNPKRQNYKWYEGRGITVCPQWHDFKTFVDWSLKNDYQLGLSLDRIDNNGNYTPDNCHWIPFRKQCLNRSSNQFLTYNGKTLTIVEWASVTGIKASTLYGRLQRGWTVEDTLTIIPNPRNNTKVGRFTKQKKEI